MLFPHWSTIKDAIVKIYAQKASSLSYEELYRTGYYLVLYKHGEMLYENVKKTTVEMLQPIAQKLVESSDEELLKEITSQWTMEKKVIRVIKEILLYLDKNFAKKARNLMNVQDMQTSLAIACEELPRLRDHRTPRAPQLTQMIDQNYQIPMNFKILLIVMPSKTGLTTRCLS